MGTLLATGARADTDALWRGHVEPLLKEHCLDCHNADKTKSGLDLSSPERILQGGDRGPAVIPGKPEESNLFKFLHADADPHMPPGKREKLSDDQAALIRQWIDRLPASAAPAPAVPGKEPAWTADKEPTRPVLDWTPPTDMPASHVVDRFLRLAWERDGIRPAPIADDASFARRLYLDVAGRVPSPAELDAFLKDERPDRRRLLVEALLDGEDYPRHMREVFNVVLMGRRSEHRPNRRRGRRGGETNLSRDWEAYLEEAFRENRPWNELVRDLILARPEDPADRGSIWFLYGRRDDPQAMAEAVAPMVFGLQVQCAQCHDHMIAREIKQAHYWAMVSVFNRSKNVDTQAGPGVAESAIGGFGSFANLKKESQPARMTFFNGRSIDEPWPEKDQEPKDTPELYLVAPPPEKEQGEKPALPKFSRRAEFAELMTDDNPLLARAMVNRVWAMLFGRGMVHPVDRMDSKHAPSQPELLDWLAADFAAHGYDVKRLIRVLCETEAYQLDSALLTSSKEPPPPVDAFARRLTTPLSAEQLFHALQIVTGPDTVAGEEAETSPDAQELGRALVKEFPDLFAEEYSPTLQQAMFLSNGPVIDQLLEPREGNLTSRLAALPDSEARVNAAFTIVYGRSPQEDERQAAVDYLAQRGDAAGLTQLLWAMLTSAEFTLNH